MAHEITKLAFSKGYTSQELAERWGVTPRHLSRVAANPYKMMIDAVNGLPDKKKPPKEVAKIIQQG